jgi:serine/threonine protein kinase
MPLAAGARIGGYEVVSLLGAGGMGEVYPATDYTRARDVAIKVLPEAVGPTPIDSLASAVRRRCSGRSIIHISPPSTALGMRTASTVRVVLNALNR